MKYSFEKIHWQEFELMSYRVLRKLISEDVKYLEEGKDGGRDIIYQGKSKSFRKDLSGLWNFQVKHKKNKNPTKTISTLKSDLKDELIKTFVKNKLKFDNYILVINLVLTGKLYDELNTIFKNLNSEHEFGCDNFDIISYRDFENVFNENERLRWDYPNVIDNDSFEKLIQNAQNRHIQNRNEKWLEMIGNQKPKFVYTSFYKRAIEKLGKYPAIILSGPPRSGKTFNAEILALNFSIHRNYQAILIEAPDDIEKTYDKEIPQIFVCDDVFGKHILTLRAEEWFKKFERILSLADDQHKIIFTSREHIFKAFTRIGDESSKKYLEKIIVESHDYNTTEKLALLFRYASLSPIADHLKMQLIDNEFLFIKHKNFSPETIRAFFININKHVSSSIIESLNGHLGEPDDYLRPVFFNLENSKQAALLAVLCSDSNKEESIYDKFKHICSDLSLTSLTNAEIEFDELHNSILKILHSSESKEIQFYHPSMQEFLFRLLINDKTNNLKDVVLQNVNTSVLDLCWVKSEVKTTFSPPSRRELFLHSNDLKSLKTGIFRSLNNPQTRLSSVKSIFNWINIENHNLELKLNDLVLQNKLKALATKIIEEILSSDFYVYHRDESSYHWSEVLADIYTTIGRFKFNISDFSNLESLIKEKHDEPYGWKIIMHSLFFLGEKVVIELLPKEYFNGFENELTNSINELAHEVYGPDFPKFEVYNIERKKNPTYEKIRNKPNRHWYPKFLIVQDKIKTLKEVRRVSTAKCILDNVGPLYTELYKLKAYAKNRHNFIVNQGWWNDEE